MRSLLQFVYFPGSLLIAAAKSTPHQHAARAFVSGTWSLSQHGTTGVAGQQLAVVSETKAIIYDKVEHNPLSDGNGHLAWSVEYDLTTDAIRPLHPLSDSWCAAGAHLSNGTLLSTGGNPAEFTNEAPDQNGLQAIRMFNACTDDQCDIIETPSIHLTSNRWYPSASRLDDGSVFIFGGSLGGGFINNAGMNNPSYEFFPPKNINGFNGVQIPSQFLKDTLNGNHFPIIFVLPDGTLFIAANTQAMIFNWRTNTENRLPNLPNGVRVTSPFSAAGFLLPLTPANNYTPEVVICGGSTLNDQNAPTSFSSQSPTSKQCVRMQLTTSGIAAGWQVESMPTMRIMVDPILLPDMRVLLVNGAQTGAAGYGNVADQIGASNADNPAFTPVIYDPSAPAGSRFSSAGLPTSNIARMYHSVATLVPDGRIMLAGSNPNGDVSTVKYATEYRVEWLSPAYLSQPQPSYTGLPATIPYNKNFSLSVTLPAGVTAVTVSLIDLGFSTHGVHMDQRLVQLRSFLSADKKTLIVTGPPTPMIYPPGPAYLYVVTSAGVPSFGHKTLVGTGGAPPEDAAALANLQAHAVAAAKTMPKPPLTGEGAVATAPIPASSSL
ncbi:hypothetical protein PUNSTDRAFT_117990 [Punctularia strigosozonata HHB-11173 SS5]|uniref:uncharacterized protein n=1 Tax=Punctularia strigosozonata (strain HHB-11173) TaxID=741275 RepID=UPI0004417E76|nr:uncharacterized protein PUNSTDRAFT_117990 [Punctularia strigosozonata HHB-11173 SS5]EIN14511.1 hypothetical protein PUNSTDRAFT_117990 [Punctularia strigosozonata HHB-11173 SS5]